MNNAEALSQFFDAENARDWARYRSFLHPEVVWELHGGGVRVIRRVEEYRSVIKAAYADSAIRFTCERMTYLLMAAGSSPPKEPQLTVVA